MDFLVVKTLHLVAVFLWTGMVPIELYAGWRFARARTDDERLGLAVLVNRLRLCQALPYGLLVVATGAWLSGWYGIALVARQPWSVAKLVLGGLWAGYIPCENILFFVAWDSRVIEQRRRAMRWVLRLTWLQEVPGIVLVVLSGLAMLSQQGGGLVREPWFQAKLGLLVVLGASE